MFNYSIFTDLLAKLYILTHYWFISHFLIYEKLLFPKQETNYYFCCLLYVVSDTSSSYTPDVFHYVVEPY